MWWRRCVVWLWILGLCLPASAARIVSLAPELTEIICRLGGREQLVGRSSVCDFPEEVRSLPVAGRFGAPSPEAILKLRADTVVAGRLFEPGARELLIRLGLRVVELSTSSVADYERAVTELGRLLNRQREAGAELTRVRALLAACRTRYAKTRRPSVLLVVWADPLTVAGRRSVLNDLIELAGGRNAAGAEDTAYFRASPEWALAARPEVVIFPTKRGAVQVPVPDSWRLWPAVRAGRCYRDLDADLVFRLGPRFTEGIRELERRIHPAPEPGKK